jgi:phosphatidate cytidylyltransferase
LANNFKIRALSSLFLLILLFSLYQFKLSHFIFLIFFGLVYFELFKNKIINIYWIILLTLVYCLFLNYDLFFYYLEISQKILILFVFIIITFVSFIKKTIRFSKIILNLFIFISFILFTLFYIHNFNLFFIVILFTSINDIIAYIIGSYFKGPKIIPIISPNKTWSGSISSYLISLSLLFYFFDFNYIYNLLLPITFFIGDIYFSNFMRIFNIKDYGRIFNGHGGFLDRFDSSFLSLSFSFIFFSFI